VIYFFDSELLLFSLDDALTKPSIDSSTRIKSLNILYLSLPAMGHLNPVLVMANTLASRGHNVTVALGIDEGLSSKYKALVSSTSVNFLRFETTVHNITHNINPSKVGLAGLGRLVAQYVQEMFQTLDYILQQENYDLVVGDEFMMTGLFCIYSHWKIPTVVVGCTLSLFINEYPPWPWPGMLQGEASDNLEFLQRAISWIEQVIFKRYFDHMMLTPQYLSLKKFCPLLNQNELFDAPGTHLPHIVPTVIGFEYSRTLTPLTEYVGPLISDNPVPLSKDLKLKEWLDSKLAHSVVYLSMGSIFRLTPTSAKALLEGVMQTDHYLLWSLNDANRWILSNLTIDPERVYMSSWTPQYSVLASGAIHCAILHGGYNGLSEALWNSVPVIGFPQMGEQVVSVGRLYHNRLGLRLDMNSLTQNDVAEAVATIDKGGYRARLQKLQKMFKLAGGVNRAAVLMEYYADVGFAHLLPAHVKYCWNWIQFYNADVWLLVCTIIMFVLWYCVWCRRRFCLCSKIKND